MILTTCAACAAPLARTAPRCVRCHPHGLPERAQLWSEDWANRTKADAFVSEARRFHDESAARLAAWFSEEEDDADPAIQAMLASINQNDALAGDPLAEVAIRHLSLS